MFGRLEASVIWVPQVCRWIVVLCCVAFICFSSWGLFETVIISASVFLSPCTYIMVNHRTESRGVVIHVNNQTLGWETQKEATQMKYLGLWIERAPVRMYLISGMFSSFWNPAEFLLELQVEIHIKQPQHWIVELLVWVWDETGEIKTQVEFCTGSGWTWRPRQPLDFTYYLFYLFYLVVAPWSLGTVCKSGQICVHCWRGSLLAEALSTWSTLTKRSIAEASGSGVILPEHFYCPFVISVFIPTQTKRELWTALIWTFTPDNVCFPKMVGGALYLSPCLVKAAIFGVQMLSSAKRKPFALCNNSIHPRKNVDWKK